MAQVLIERDGPSHYQAFVRMADGEIRFISLLPSREAAEEWVQAQVRSADCQRRGPVTRLCQSAGNGSIGAA